MLGNLNKSYYVCFLINQKINKMEKTLLEKAMAIKGNVRRDKLTDEEYELGIAWVKKEISFAQITKVMGYNNVNSVYTLISKCFTRYYEKNKSI